MYNVSNLIPCNGQYFTKADEVEYGQYFSKCYKCLYPNSTYNDLEMIRTVTFIVTENCNLNCSYCYECSKTKRTMTKEIARKAIDMLFDKTKLEGYFDLDKTKGYIIEVFGGEPFLEPDIIDYIFSYYLETAYHKNKEIFYYSHFNTTTNGTLYFSPEVQHLIHLYGEKFSIGVTVDGNKELHDTCRKFKNGRGSYDLAAKALKAATKDKVDRHTKLTIAPENVSYLSDALINLWDNLQIQIVHANCVYEDVWQLKDAKLLYRELIKVADYLLEEERYAYYYVSLFDETLGVPVPEDMLDKNYCGGNGQMLAITPDGQLYPCSRFAPYSLKNQKGFCIGNVNEGIYKGNSELERLQQITLRSQSDEKCLSCQVGNQCGLCSAYNYDKFGTPNKRATAICDCHKATVCANAYYWNKLYKKLGINRTFPLNISNIYI